MTDSSREGDLLAEFADLVDSDELINRGDRFMAKVDDLQERFFGSGFLEGGSNGTGASP